MNLQVHCTVQAGDGFVAYSKEHTKKKKDSRGILP